MHTPSKVHFDILLGVNINFVAVQAELVLMQESDWLLIKCISLDDKISASIWLAAACCDRPSQLGRRLHAIVH